MKLIKTQNKFILVSNEEPILNDFIMDENDNIIKVDKKVLFNCQHEFKIFWKKIIAGIPELPSVDFSLLSKEDCKIIGWVDVEKLCPCIGKDFRVEWINGFKTAQSLNDKKFSLEDMGNLWQFIVDGAKQIMLSGTTNVGSFEEYIQSLQQTSWDCICEMEYFYMSSKEFYKDADWIKCDKYQYDSIQQTIPTCPIKIGLKITDNSIKLIKIL